MPEIRRLEGNRRYSVKLFDFERFSPKQMSLIHWYKEGSPYLDYDMVIADGAVRSGKTIAMICSFLQWSQHLYQGESFIIAGKSMGALKRNVVGPMLQIMGAWGWGYYYNRSQNYLVIGGNTYYLFGASTEAAQDAIQGMTAAGAFGDESAIFPQSFLDQMITRCSVARSKVFLNCNPAGGENHFFYRDYIQKRREKKIYYLRFDMEDNYSLDKGTKEKYRRMFQGVFYKRYILGQWTVAEGLIYDMFARETHVVAKDGGSFEQYYVSIDYGTQNATVFLLWGKRDRIWYVIKEYYYSGREQNAQKTDLQYVQDLKAFVQGIVCSGIIVDPSAASFIAQLRLEGLRNIIRANNNVTNGIRNTATAMSEGRFFVWEECVNLIEEISGYAWDKKASAQGEDKPVKEKDHACDAMRYFVNTVLYNGSPRAGTW